MGKRGPVSGAKYSRRPLITTSIVVQNDRQLRHAQQFCEQLDALLTPIERGDFPVAYLAPDVREKLRKSAEAVQHSVIEGIERFYDKHRYSQSDD